MFVRIKNKNYALNQINNLLIQIKINIESIHQFVYKVIDQSTDRFVSAHEHYQNGQHLQNYQND